MPDKTPDEKVDGRRTRPFADFLADHNRGAQAREAAEALQKVVGSVVDTGKKGSVTVTVNIEPVKNAEPGTLQTTIAVASKVPVMSPRAAVFFADDDDNLVREDPRQPTFEGLQGVGTPEVREGAPAPQLAGGIGSSLRAGESVSVNGTQIASGDA